MQCLWEKLWTTRFRDHKNKISNFFNLLLFALDYEFWSFCISYLSSSPCDIWVILHIETGLSFRTNFVNTKNLIIPVLWIDPFKFFTWRHLYRLHYSYVHEGHCFVIAVRVTMVHMYTNRYSFLQSESSNSYQNYSLLWNFSEYWNMSCISYV